MAQETEVVVFEVDVSQYEKSLADLTKSINGLKDTQAALQKQTKEGATGAAESLEKVNAQLKLQQQEYRTTQNILVGYTGAQQKNVNVLDFAKNSIQANRDLLKQLTAQYINTTAPSEKFTNQIKKLSDELKKQEGAIGDTRRNVGNYFNEFAKGIPQLGAAVEGVKNVSSAFKAAGGGIQGFSAALATTGLPLFIAGINLLIDAFSSFEPIANAVNDIMAGLSASFASSYAEGVKLSQLKREIEINDRNQLVTNAELKKSITELEVVAANKAANDEDRIKALKEANALRDKQLEIDKQDLAERKEAVDLEVKLSKESNKNKAAALGTLNVFLGIKTKEIEANKELLTQQKQLEADRIALEEMSFQQQQENRNKIDLLNKQIEEDKAKRLQESKAAQDKADADAERLAQQEIARLNKLADTNERLEQLRIETLEKGLQKEEDLYKLSFEKKIPDLIAAGLTEQQIVEAQQQGLNEIRAKYAVKAVEIEEGKFEKIAQAQDKANVDANDKALKAQQDTGAAITQAVIQTVNAISGILSSVSALIQQTAEQNIQSLQEQAGDGAAEQKRVATESRQIKLKAWKEARAINLTMAVMNTANAVMAQISNPTPYVGFVLAALAAATGAIQIATIAKQKPPSFALGGKVVSIGGKSHADGGTPIHVGGQHVAEAEAGEGLFVMKKDAYNDIQMLSGWNQRYGGRSFTGNKTNFAADGGEIQIPSDGGFSTRSIRSATDNAMQVEMAIMNGFKKAPAPELSIVELNSKQSSRNRSVDVVSL